MVYTETGLYHIWVNHSKLYQIVSAILAAIPDVVFLLEQKHNLWYLKCDY